MAGLVGVKTLSEWTPKLWAEASDDAPHLLGATRQPSAGSQACCAFYLFVGGLTPPAAGIRDAVHRRARPRPPCPRPVTARSAASLRLSTAINLSASCSSSRSTLTGTLEDAVPRARRRGQGIRVVLSQSRARHRRFCHGERGAIMISRMSSVLA